MKILLIQPMSYDHQSFGPPLGLAYIASGLEEAGHDVKIIDGLLLNCKLRHIKKEIKSYDPEIVGVSATTPYIHFALSYVNIAKKIKPNCITILGGTHPTFRDKEILQNNQNVDIIVRGEAEITLVELLKKIKENDISSVNGITYRQENRIIRNDNREFIKDLDSIPFPAYHLLDMDKYVVSRYDAGITGELGKQFTTMITSRGCPFACYFCASGEFWSKREKVWRGRSPENIVEEIKLLTSKYKKEIIEILDDTFTYDKQRAIKICELINKENIDVELIITTRVDFFDKDIALALKKAGGTLVWFGVESSNQMTLDFLKKGFKVEDTIKAVKIAKEAGLEAAGYFAIGSPHETKEMIEDSIDFAYRLGLKFAGFPILIPFPGTELFEMAEKNGLLKTKDWSKYMLNNPVMKLEHLTDKELKKIQKNAYLHSKFNR